MAPKILRPLLLWFLFSNIFIANASLFPILSQKSLTINNYDEEAKIRAQTTTGYNKKNLSLVFQVLPKGQRVPPSGPSKRVNVAQN
jgi:hypothetical protein